MTPRSAGRKRARLRLFAIPLVVLVAVTVSTAAAAGAAASRSRAVSLGQPLVWRFHPKPVPGKPLPPKPLPPKPSATPPTTPPTSPSSTPPSSPPSAPAVSAGFPNAANTGYPHGLPGDTRAPVTLSAYTGPCTIKTDGTVIDSKLITCQLDIRAHNVVIRNSLIRVADTRAIYVNDFYNLLVEDTELDGQGRDTSTGGQSLIGDGSYTLRRVNAHGSGDILRADWWTEVYDSWLHDPLCVLDSCHNDVIQTTQTEHLRVMHNRLENQHTQTSCILEKADLGRINDVVIDGNLFNGGGYSVYWYDAGYKATNGAFTNNRFMRAPTGGYWPKGGKYGPGATQAAQAPIWTGNVWDDDGTTIPG